MPSLAPLSPKSTDVEPFITPETRMRELSWRALLTGTFLGMVFGASSLYLTLKVGLTVSASIPVAVLGGLLGILMMIPLRRALIVKEHNVLKYPEGTACAAVLKAGASADCREAASPAAKEEMLAATPSDRGNSTGATVI